MPTADRTSCRIAIRLIALISVLATGLTTACAQGPETVVPTPRQGSPMILHEQFVEQAKKGNVDLLFLGDSITQGWNNNDIWRRFYGPRKAANFGIGGDRTQHVLWRIQNGELDGITPKVIVLMIGTNNATVNTTDELAQGVTAIVQELRKRLPATQILLLAVFPRRDKPSPIPERLQEVNQKIAKLDDGAYVRYLDIGAVFVSADNSISRHVMGDLLHLTQSGYRKWADAMEPTLWSMLDEPKR